jgi:putative ABC transport system permease protein
MKIRDLTKLSTRMFKARTSRTFLTILGMGVGIGAILFLVSLGYGIQKALLETITTADSLLSLDVYPSKNEESIGSDSIEKIKNVPGVIQVSPVYDSSIQAKYENTISDSRGLIIDLNYLKLSGIKIINGSEIDDNESQGIVISPTFSKLFDREPNDMIGESITVSVKYIENINGEKRTKKVDLVDPYKIIGVADVKDNLIFINELSIKNSIDITEYSRLKIKCKSSQDVSAVRDNLAAEGFIVSALSDIVTQADKVFGIVRIILGFFGMIALLVSAIGMFNTMTVTLLERTEEIGIMKSIGAYDRDILYMFVYESTIMGFLGGIFGILLGIVGAKIFNFFVNIIAQRFGGDTVNLFYFPIWFLGFILLSATVVGFITGIIPAKRASSTDPLDALRYK